VESRRNVVPVLRRPRRRVRLALVLALAASSASGNVTATEKRDLSFGLVAAGQATGAVTVTPAGAVFCGPHTCLGGQQAERLKLSGDKHGVYDITYSTGDVLDHAGGGGSIPLGSFTDSAGGLLILNGGGQAQLFVGGALTVGPLTTGGDYTGSYTIIFNLQ
jgi:hypothetical protein